MFLHSLVRYGSIAPVAALALIGAPAAPGDLDPAFAIGGKVSTDFERRFDEGRGMAIQPDGRIVVAGEMIRTVDPQDPPFTGDRNFAVVRYLANGALDTSFSGDGRATIDFGGDDDAARSVTLQPDGKIVVAGEGTHPNTTSRDIAVVRYIAR